MELNLEQVIKSGVERAMTEYELTIGMTLKEAIEKQIPQKPSWDDSVPHSRCPVCHSVVSAYIDSPKLSYCYHCGQALDWSDNNAE